MKNVFFRILLLITYNIYPCTTAIVSGNFTTDGRPLLLKHRDSDNFQNKLQYFKDGKYAYIGLVNSKDTKGKEVWGGVNSKGFAIINSASYNLKEKEDTTKIKDREGFIMKMALQECRTIEEFENLLINLKKPLGVEANFGVIDAYGGAAYFETNNFDFIKIDVNDEKIAPYGFVIRTNYSEKGRKDEGYGYIRYATAKELFTKAANDNNLNYKFILQDVSRSLKHSLLDVDYLSEKNITTESNRMIPFQDYIPRYSSVSTILIHGTKKNDAPELATLWTILGFQLTSIAMPTWVKAGNNIPTILIADSSGNAPLCNYALQLKQKCYPIKRGSGYRYIKLSELINNEKRGLMQIINKKENEIFVKTDEVTKKWIENKTLTINEAKTYYTWVNKEVQNLYNEKFNLK